MSLLSANTNAIAIKNAVNSANERVSPSLLIAMPICNTAAINKTDFTILKLMPFCSTLRHNYDSEL
ncbi:hypothetical protein CGK08_06685 [Vibrio parahaemolyticus]|nr:hypothetical protein CGK08_06685 [Vibrio parahaemolyticus]